MPSFYWFSSGVQGISQNSKIYIMEKLTKTIEIQKENFTYIVTLTSVFMVGIVSKYGSTNFQIKLKHSGESVGYGKMSKQTAKRIINHTEQNFKFFI